MELTNLLFDNIQNKSPMFFGLQIAYKKLCLEQPCFNEQHILIQNYNYNHYM